MARQLSRRQERCSKTIMSSSYPSCHTTQMKEIKVESTFGNYKWNASVIVGETQVDALLGMGILQILQRTPASVAEKAMAGYEKRPPGFKRDSIPYSESGAKILMDAMEAAEVGKDDPLAIEVIVGEYIPGEGAIPKFTDEKAIVTSKGGDATRLAATAKVVGYDGDDLTVENTEFLRAIKTYRDVEAKKVKEAL